MKKQLLIAAVAATMGTAAMADLSINGNGKFEYFNSETGTAASTNKTNTEVNLGFVGKTGATSVVLNMEFNTHGRTSVSDTDTDTDSDDSTAASTNAAANADNNTLHIEDMYMTTKVGDVAVKAGNFGASTSGLLGEIDNGGRATNKVILSTSMGGATVYMGNGGTVTNGQGSGKTQINSNMFAGISMSVAGMKVQAKKIDEDTNAFGISGDMNGVGYRLEQKSDTAANGDVTFAQISGASNGIALTYAVVDADVAGKISEDDSGIFAVSASGGSTVKGIKQFSATTSLAGNSITVKSGSVEGGIDATNDIDYVQIKGVRKLASGATAAVTYTDKSATATTDTTTLEVDLSVKF